MKTYVEPLAEGNAVYSDASGKLEMVFWESNNSTSFKKLMSLRRALKSIPNLQLTKSDWGTGWKIKHLNGNFYQNYSRFTLYRTGDGRGFSLFECKPDIWRGIDISDEKLLFIGQENQIVELIKKELLIDSIGQSFKNNQPCGPCRE